MYIAVVGSKQDLLLAQFTCWEDVYDRFQKIFTQYGDAGVEEYYQKGKGDSLFDTAYLHWCARYDDNTNEQTEEV